MLRKWLLKEGKTVSLYGGHWALPPQQPGPPEAAALFLTSSVSRVAMPPPRHSQSSTSVRLLSTAPDSASVKVDDDLAQLSYNGVQYRPSLSRVLQCPVLRGASHGLFFIPHSLSGPRDSLSLSPFTSISELAPCTSPPHYINVNRFNSRKAFQVYRTYFQIAVEPCSTKASCVSNDTRQQF